MSAAARRVHALSAVVHGSGTVRAQAPIAVHGDKAQAELTVAPALLRRLDWRGRVLTGDALSCQRSLCQQVVAAGGDYLLVVKDNQPNLHEDLRLLLDPPPGAPSPSPTSGQPGAGMTGTDGIRRSGAWWLPPT